MCNADDGSGPTKCPNCGFDLKPRAVGRPRSIDDARVWDLRERGFSYRAIAEQIGCSEGAIRASVKRKNKKDTI